MVRDSKRFADSGGWGQAAFNYDSASDTFTPATLADNPPQGNDAKCGCHTILKAKDYVFTAYPRGKVLAIAGPETRDKLVKYLCQNQKSTGGQEPLILPQSRSLLETSRARG